MKQIAIVSGKGGTGKTTLTASIAAMAEGHVMVDADVDAADLHLVLPPSILRQSPFTGGRKAVINPEKCTRCGECLYRCRFHAISDDFIVDPIACEGCSVCVHFCPENAIDFPVQTCGEWFVSDTEFAPMVHAKLGIAEENSGLLVTLLRKEAVRIAEEKQKDLIIIDGPPGIGCPVIASLTGTDGILIITEPTVSGIHDMKRIHGLAEKLRIPAMLCINKYDLNPEATAEMEAYGTEHGITLVGRIPFDRAATDAMVAGHSLVEHGKSAAAEAIRDTWHAAEKFIVALPDKS